ncbi:MAG: YcxB family protein, partial [Lachnospira sp.]|nr:YcxB family protein [Lachnospira sp.]
EPVKYTVTEEKMVLSQGEVSEDLLWDDIYKIKFTGKSIVLYLTAVRANVIPIGCLGDQLEPFMDIAEKKLKPFQIKVDMEKAKKAAKRA